MKILHYALIIISALALTALSGCKSLKTPPTAEQIAAHQTALDVLRAKAFQVKADRLTVQNQSIPGALESTNFVNVLGDKALVQVSPGMSGGPNGLGGFTVRGTVTGYNMTTKSNGETRVEYHVSATVGPCDVTIVLSPRSADATVFVNNSFRNLKATIYGEVEPLDDSFNKGYTPF